MAKIDEYDAEMALQELARRLPEESQELISTMVECRVTAPDAYIEDHREWRGDRGMPKFRAIIHYTNEEHEPIFGGDYIRVEVTGTFKELRGSPTVESWSVQDCHLFNPHERYVKPF
jgi:hypothetical protein